MSSIAVPLHKRADTTGRRPDMSTYVLLILLAWVCAGAVAGSHWIPGSDAILTVAVGGMPAAILLARVAPRGITYWLATEVSLIAVLFIFTARHSGAVTADFAFWVVAIEHDLNLALLIAMVLGTWLGAAWTAYWVLGHGNLPLGLAPMAVVLAVEVLNDPGESGLTVLVLAWMVLAALLLMRHTVARLGGRWGAAGGPELSSRVGIQGSRTLVLLLVAASILPPLSTVDLSGLYFGASSQSADGRRPSLARRQGASPAFVQTGYSERVEPGGTLVRSLAPVMEVTSDFTRQVYWRGISLYAVRSGAWEEGGSIGVAAAAPNQPVAEDPYLARQAVHATVKVLGVAQNTIFWPGDPLRASIPAQVRGVPAGNFDSSLALASVDTVYARNPVARNATYSVDSSVSVATEEQLRQAGTDYPPIVTALTLRVAGGVASSSIDHRVAELAREVAAAQPTTYDKVKAIETYLRTNLKYQLQVTPPPPDGDPVAYFLLSSKVGYCEYFASAMGEMVRSLGIPVRLADGYGPGSSEDTQDRSHGRGGNDAGLPRIVRAADAHTWVEVFFPTYGWVPFEPTPDPAYPVLDRSAIGGPIPSFPGAVVPPATAVSDPVTRRSGPSTSTAPVLEIAALGIAVLLMVALMVALWARGPAKIGTLEAVWWRLGWLAARLGQPRRPSDTPVEFTGRLATAMPALGPAIADLGRAYSQRCYRREGIADSERRHAQQAWRRVRRAIVRELIWPSVRRHRADH